MMQADPGFSSSSKVSFRRSFSDDLGGRISMFDRGQPAKRCVGAALIVIPPPSLDPGPGVPQ